MLFPDGAEGGGSPPAGGGVPASGGTPATDGSGASGGSVDSSVFVRLAQAAGAKSDDSGPPGGGVRAPIGTEKAPAEVLEGEFNADDLPEDARPEPGSEPTPKRRDATPPTEVERPEETQRPKFRDYSKFDPADVKTLKQLPNFAFAFVEKKLGELRAAQERMKALEGAMQEKGIPENYVNHPEAYTLLPGYQENVNNYSTATGEYQHWRQQLVNIAEGRPWFNIEGYDEKTGEMILSKPYKPSKEAEIDVQNALHQAQMLQAKFRDNVSQLREGFQVKYQQSLKAIDDERAERFAWVRDPKILDTTIDLADGSGKRKLSEIRAVMENKIPTAFRNHPLANALSDIWVAVQIYASQYMSVRKELARYQRNSSDGRRAEPTSEINPPSNGSGNRFEFDASGMPE